MNNSITHRYWMLCCLAAMLTNYSSTIFADGSDERGSVRLGRYLSVPSEATPQQKNILQVLIGPMQLGSQLNTVGDAIVYILKRSGYTLADLDESNIEMESLLKLTLPLVHRTIGPITIIEALKTLAGPSWTLKVDHVNRKISFVLFRYTINEYSNSSR